MLLICLQPAHDAPTGVSGIPIEFLLPVTVVAMLIGAFVFMFYLTIRDTAPGCRPDAVKEFVALVCAMGEAIGAVLEAIARLFR
jgi:hypothetical protein